MYQLYTLSGYTAGTSLQPAANDDRERIWRPDASRTRYLIVDFGTFVRATPGLGDPILKLGPEVPDRSKMR